MLAGTGHEGSAYELGGDPAFTLAELAAEIGAQAGRGIVYRDLPQADYAQVLVGAGVPEPMAEIPADSDRGIARGDLFVAGDDLRRLIGRPSTPLHDAVAAALSGRERCPGGAARGNRPSAAAPAVPVAC